MAAPVVPNPSCLELTETAIEKDNFGDWVHFYYSKKSFFGQSKYKNRKGFRTSAWPRAKRAETPKINGRRCAPPTKWLVTNLKVKSWSE